MSGQRQQWDLLSNWATGEICEAQAAHRGSGMGDLELPSPPAEVKLGVEPGWGGCVMAGEVWHGPKHVWPRGSVWIWPQAYMGGSGGAQLIS